MKRKLNSLGRAVLNSYAIIFFSQNKGLGLLLLLATFFNPSAGFTGFAFASIAIACSYFAKFSSTDIQKGIYSFNALLLGLSLGTFYHLNIPFIVWGFFACIACVLLTSIFNLWSIRKNLPFLALPFIITFCILFSAANSVFNLGLQQRESIILDELTADSLLRNAVIPAIKLPYYLGLYFKALSAVVFQDNSLAGILIAIGLLIHSRIAFSLSVIAFVVALGLNSLTGTYPEGLSAFHLGSNIMLTVLGLGSFFQVPRVRSYLFSLFSIPLVFLLINALTKMLGIFDLPIISLPFCTVTLFAIRALVAGKSKLFPIINTYSPEINLYLFLNSAERLNDLKYVDIKLPFLGEWFVTQGYNGGVTHKNEWGQALDFVIKDENGFVFKGTGMSPENYHCYGKPVLSCGNGVVEQVVDHIADNPIGGVNVQENWGNTIIIKHTNGLFSKVSHLKQGSAKVRVGDFVQQGDIIGLCGNSGRSPEPHLHFQIQATPYIDAKTLAYPFSSYLDYVDDEPKPVFHDTPAEGHSVQTIVLSDVLRRSFDFRPGFVALLVTGEKTETVSMEIDEFNRTYLYAKENDVRAYFINNGTSMYFTDFEGDKSSMLYLFYLAAYKITFAQDIEITDKFPLQYEPAFVLRTVQDLVSPFYRFIELSYSSIAKQKNGTMHVETAGQRSVFNQTKNFFKGDVQFSAKGLQRFEIMINGQKTIVEWVGQNI